MEDMDWPSPLPILDNSLEEVEAGGPERLKWESAENKNKYIFDPSGPENLKKSRPKKLVKSNKSISRNFDKNPFFAISKIANNQFLNYENCQKLQFHEKQIFDLFDFTTFLPRLF